MDCGACTCVLACALALFAAVRAVLSPTAQLLHRLSVRPSVSSTDAVLSACSLVLTVTIFDMQHVFDVRRFGAVGDGVTDSTLAISSAMEKAATAAASSAEECTVHVPRGGTFLTRPIALSRCRHCVEGK